MNVGIGTEAVQFLFWEYIIGFSVQCNAAQNFTKTIRMGLLEISLAKVEGGGVMCRVTWSLLMYKGECTLLFTRHRVLEWQIRHNLHLSMIL
jgi:hypothetical protein